MVESAALFGNLLMLRRLYENTGVNKSELNSAHVAAFCSKRKHRAAVVKFLKDKDADNISLSLCCSIGNIDAVKTRMSDGKIDDEDFKSAIEFSTGRPDILAELLGTSQCKNVLSTFSWGELKNNSQLISCWLTFVTRNGTLNLKDLEMGIDGAKALSKSLMTNSCIKTLDLSNTVLFDDGGIVHALHVALKLQDFGHAHRGG